MLVGSSCIKVNDRIILKRLKKKDSKDLFAISKNNQEELKKWFSWASDITLELTEEFLAKSIEDNKNNKRCDFGIFYQDKLAGIISIIHPNKKIKELELAYWLSKDFYKKGIMTKSCKKLIDYCFNQLDFEEIFVEFFPDNKASHNLAERLGFKIDEFQTKARIINDKRSFYICYSLKKLDYKNNFWNNLDKILKKSKIVIDYKKGSKFNGHKDIICPVDFGHLENGWEEDEMLEILIGSDEKSDKVNTILCTMDMVNKFSDIKILHQCTEREKKKLFEIHNKLQGSILVERQYE